ncbi:hypothetical protein BOTNAR_1780g00010 [Botryotinia narcissicola]|uniref:Aminoglycoside phosphotransferase domain-containing protein n=1 Tax=Botryotinia narcissicola TaxID=278944 RepID=A0A4Z1H530_9HELO|nr:hypothetical protein BOTNAR_1780g00010 [Botryotinia narcissicola]
MAWPLTVYEPFEGNTKEEFDAHVPKEQEFLLCHNCGWTVYHQVHYWYVSHIKVMCNGARGIWFIGDDYILKERAILEYGRASIMGADVSISKFLTENSTVPVLRVAGNSMSKDEIRVIAKEVVEHLIEVRKFTSPKIGAPDGSNIRDRVVSSNERVQFVTDDVEKWWTRAKLRLSKEQIERWNNVIKEIYPVKGGPYVLTHGDLDASNIMVKDGHLTGIIDWEAGGYLPEWWELVANSVMLPPLWGFCFREEWKTQIGPLPEEEIQFARTFKNFFKEYYPRQIEPEPFFDQDSYVKCPNYRRFLKESRDGFASTVRQRESRKKKAAEDEIAALAALKKLSFDERKRSKIEDIL